MNTTPEYRNTQRDRGHRQYRAERMYQREKRRRRRRRRNTALTIIFCILVVGAVGSLFGYILSSRRSNNAVTETVETAADTVTETAAPTASPEPEVSAASIPEPSEGNNDLIDVIAKARLDGMTKHCYLTFDDGPSSKVTGEVLDTLKKYDIKATFFEVGKNIREYPDVTKRVYNEGHLVANHSYNHEYDSLYATEESFKEEIEKTESAIKETTGQQEIFKLIRFPGGSYNAGDHASQKQIYKKTLAGMGYYYCDWNSLNGDAEGKTKNKTELIEFFKSSAAEFINQDKNLIVLMHDSDAKQATADALESIITYLKDNGYTFHRLDDIEV